MKKCLAWCMWGFVGLIPICLSWFWAIQCTADPLGWFAVPCNSGGLRLIVALFGSGAGLVIGIAIWDTKGVLGG